ncbi:MAG: 3-phosphoshikimate 1-carboxyvinyltransferase [Alistipes sp.]|nr:3-phosphoshikimate 1-carboxyvinyltransferase [Rikenellaceae bacterium]MBR1961471.1 3-phosphoshikimate 1-carboxyvinyltransferase [Alistipes sp.]
MDKSVPRGQISGVATPPCSKSYAQRALAAALLAEGETVLRNLDFCDDTLSAISTIEALGAEVERLDERTVKVRGGLAPKSDTLQVGESGLATRMFTPIASLCNTPITVQGRGTLLYRPMNMMIEPLRKLGVDVRDGGGRLPIEVCGPMQGGEIEVDGSVSSQFLTGLLMALPLAGEDTTILVENAVSKPYLDMTIDMASKFGVNIQHNDYKEFYVEGGQHYEATDLSIEGDWSAAAMLLVAGAVAGEITLTNISLLSKQADVAICDALVRAGASVTSEPDRITVSHRDLVAFEFDATQCPDLFPALAALAAAAEGESVIYGVHRLEHKESNRAETIASEYAKLGIEVELDGDVMRIRGGEIHATEVESHHDHRIAMSLAVSALRSDGEMLIHGAECVAKSFPDFFETLESLRVSQ